MVSGVSPALPPRSPALRLSRSLGVGDVMGRSASPPGAHHRRPLQKRDQGPPNAPSDGRGAEGSAAVFVLLGVARVPLDWFHPVGAVTGFVSRFLGR